MGSKAPAVRSPGPSRRLPRVNRRPTRLPPGPALRFVRVLSIFCLTLTTGSALAAQLKPIGDDCGPTGISSACTTDTTSEYCISENYFGEPPSAVFSGGPPEWSGGYCSQACLPGSSSCPAGTACSPVSARSGQWSCLKSCAVGGTACRTNYSCDPAYATQGGTAPSPVCVPSVFSDADCEARLGAGFVMRPCDRLCVARQTPTAVVGDRCSQDSQCGSGQLCLKLSNGADGVCSQRCGSGAVCGCPTGSSCQAAGANGESYCLRTCASGSCPTALTCAAFGTAKVCLPPCSSDTQCPVNLTCQQGACRSTATDPGCPLCGNPGVGSQPGFNSGGGSGPTPPSSGGCTTTESSLLGMVALGAMLLPLLRRRRS